MEWQLSKDQNGKNRNSSLEMFFSVIQNADSNVSQLESDHSLSPILAKPGLDHYLQEEEGGGDFPGLEAVNYNNTTCNACGDNRHRVGGTSAVFVRMFSTTALGVVTV